MGTTRHAAEGAGKILISKFGKHLGPEFSQDIILDRVGVSQLGIFPWIEDKHPKDK